MTTEISHLFEEAKNLRKIGRFKEALSLLDQISNGIQDNQRHERIICYNEQSRCYWRIGDLKKAETYSKEALKLAKEEPMNIQGQGEAYANFGAISDNRGDLEQAEYWYTQSLALKEILNDPRELAFSLNNLGNVYFRLGELKLSEEYHKRSHSIKLKIGDSQDIASSLINLGNVYFQLGEYDRAEKNYLESFELLKQLENPQYTAIVLNNLGEINLQRGEIYQSEMYYLESLDLFEKLNNPKHIANLLNNLGEVYWQQGKHIDAEKSLQRSINLRKQIGNPQEVAESRYLLGTLFLIQDELGKASIQINRLANLSKETMNPNVEIQYNLLNALLKQKEHENAAALRLAEKAKSQAESIPHFGLQIDSMRLLIQILIQSYLFDEKEELLKQTETLLLELEELCKMKHLNGMYIESTIIRGLFYQTTFDLTKAADCYHQAKEQAAKLGLKRLSLYALKETEKLQKQIKRLQQFQKRSPKSYEQDQLREVLSYIQKQRLSINK